MLLGEYVDLFIAHFYLVVNFLVLFVELIALFLKVTLIGFDRELCFFQLFHQLCLFLLQNYLIILLCFFHRLLLLLHFHEVVTLFLEGIFLLLLIDVLQTRLACRQHPILLLDLLFHYYRITQAPVHLVL